MLEIGILRVPWLLRRSYQGQSPNNGPKPRQMGQLASCWVAQICWEVPISQRLQYNQRPSGSIHKNAPRAPSLHHKSQIISKIGSKIQLFSLTHYGMLS